MIRTDLLSRFLKKIGATSFSDLNEEEKKTYRAWEESLNGRRLTDDDVKEFFANELEATIALIPQQRLGSKDDTFLKVKLEFLRKTQAFLDRPRLEKLATEKSLEREIESL